MKKKDQGVEYVRVADHYFNQRGLRRYAGVWSLWALGVGAVISGDFFGWNFGLAAGGFGGLLALVGLDQVDRLLADDPRDDALAGCHLDALADQVVAAWTREGKMELIADTTDDVVNHARRLVAQRCLYEQDGKSHDRSRLRGPEYRLRFDGKNSGGTGF